MKYFPIITLSGLPLTLALSSDIVKKATIMFIEPATVIKTMADSMLSHERILEAVYCAIDEVNLQLAEERRIDKSANAILLGESGNLESIELISLIVTVEEEIGKAFNVSINLIDNLVGIR